MGSLFCWVFFPWLNIDIPTSLIYNYSGGINTIYCISASAITCVGVSCLINGKLSLKDLIYSPVVGGVIIGSSAAFISNSVGAILMGVTAGGFHIIFQRIESRMRRYVLIENNVFFTFALQGLFGGLLSAIFVYLANTYNFAKYSANSEIYSLPAWTGQLIGSGISAGIGLLGGLILSPVICLINHHTKIDHYHDRAYWIIEHDCISYKENIHFT